MAKQVPISSKNTRAAQRAHAKARQEFKTYDTSAITPKKSKMPIVVLIVLIAAVAIAVFLIVRAFSVEDIETLPRGEEAVVEIDAGSGAKEIANDLLEARLIPNTQVFMDLVTEKNAASALIPGTYVFYGGTTADDILTSLMTGPASTGYTLSVPEGLTRENIAATLEAATSGRITAQQFLDASADAAAYAPDFAFLTEAGNNSLEGFLFPKTYTVTAADSAESVVRMMLAQYQTETNGVDWAYPTDAGLGRYEALILASIVEKEATAENMATVASVFYNRLDSDRPYLESDATTAYEVGHDPTPDEVHADTPYSTYTHAGLPPTPICNPSLAAIQAVCAPADTDYLYFYFQDGQYTFSETYEDHQNAFSS